MNEKQRAGHQGRKSESIGNFLQCRASSAGSRRGDERAGKNVNDNANCEVKGSHEGLADYESFVVFGRVTHLRRNREKSRSAGVREYERGYSIHGTAERCSAARDNFKVGDEGLAFRRGGWTALNADSNGSNEDYTVIRREI